MKQEALKKNAIYFLFWSSNLRLCADRKMPEKEEEHLTPATRLLEKRKEMAEVENALTAEKEVNFLTFWAKILIPN